MQKIVLRTINKNELNIFAVKSVIHFITGYQSETAERNDKMSERELKLKIIEKAEIIAKAISRGKDVELRKSASGISVCEVSKRVVAR